MLPFLEVEVDGISYDFRSMGLGEFAALVLLWRLRRLRANTVVLLEGPETYLSARASSAFHAVADYVGLDVHSLRRHAVSTWLRDPDNTKSAKELVDDVLTALTGRARDSGGDAPT